MDWVKWIIPLIAVAVWILSNLAKNREEPRRQRTAPPPRPDDGMGPSRRLTPVEVDRFLEEVRRRREAAEGKTKKPLEKPAPPPLAQPMPLESRLPRAKPIPPVIRRTSPPEPVLAKIVSVPEPEATTPIVVPKVTAVPTSPQVKETLALLRNRKSLVTAMLLREILEQPLCKRTGVIPAHRK
jgi:hypothetical protein